MEQKGKDIEDIGKEQEALATRLRQATVEKQGLQDELDAQRRALSDIVRQGEAGGKQLGKEGDADVAAMEEAINVMQHGFVALCAGHSGLRAQGAAQLQQIAGFLQTLAGMRDATAAGASSGGSAPASADGATGGWGMEADADMRAADAAQDAGDRAGVARLEGCAGASDAGAGAGALGDALRALRAPENAGIVETFVSGAPDAVRSHLQAVLGGLASGLEIQAPSKRPRNTA